MEALKFEEFIMRNDEIMMQEMKEINHLIELREMPEEYWVTDNTPSHLGLPKRIHVPYLKANRERMLESRRHGGIILMEKRLTSQDIAQGMLMKQRYLETK
jgi:hypothetical protein